MSKKVYGIDLGTTYSCISCVDEHSKPVVYQNAENDTTTPSVVYFESPENTVVGQAAKEVVAIYPDQCVSTVKRAMGDPNWQRILFDRTYTPQDVSSFILRKVAGDAKQITGDEIEDVVITCPAYFGVNEKEATKQAGILAGLNVLYVIPEPTAAALAYGMEQDQEQVVLVYDLGGGTFDVTLIAVKPGDISVICTGGDHELGGKNWDEAIVNYFAERFEEETDTSADALIEDKETYQELLNAAERCKKALSSRASVIEAIRFEGDRARVELTRETFDQITAQFLLRTFSLTEQEIEKAKQKGHERIDKLLLVGGSTFMPQVINGVKERFPFEARQFDPNQAVAKGAAIFGYKCYLDEQIKIHIAEATGKSADDVDQETESQDLVEQAQKEVAQRHGLKIGGVKQLNETKITNVTSKSFGIVVINSEDREVVANLIRVDDRVPSEVTQQFGTYEEGQTQADLRCMENKLNEDEIELSSSQEIGKAVLSFGHPLPKDSPIEITFKLGPDGLLELKGRELEGGSEVEARFETEAVMSHEEIEAARGRNLSMEVA